MNDSPRESPATADPAHFPAQSVLARCRSAVGEALPDDFALLDLETGAYFSLGEVGGFVWERLDGVATLAEIASAMVVSFDIDERQAQADLQRFVAALTARRLARLVSAD